MIKHLSWHPGTSVLKNTINHAFGDIMDTMVVVIILLMGLVDLEACYLVLLLDLGTLTIFLVR